MSNEGSIKKSDNPFIYEFIEGFKYSSDDREILKLMEKLVIASILDSSIIQQIKKLHD